MAQTPEQQQEFWIKFKTDLETNYTFPAEYIYKFILPSQEQKINQLKDIFKHTNAEYSFKESSTKKYTSVTIKAIFTSAEEIIEYYKNISVIEGIMSL